MQTMRSKAAPVTPIASATTFRDLPDLVAGRLANVSVEELTLVGEGVNEEEKSERDDTVVC